MYEEYDEDEVTPSVNPGRFRRLLELGFQAVAEERGRVTADGGSFSPTAFGLNLLMSDAPNQLNDPVLTFLEAVDQHFGDDDAGYHNLCARVIALALISRNKAFQPWWTNPSPAERRRLYVANTHAASIAPLDASRKFDPSDFFSALTQALVE